MLEEEYKLRERHLKEREQSLTKLIAQREKEVLDLQKAKEEVELNYHRRRSELLLSSFVLNDDEAEVAMDKLATAEEVNNVGAETTTEENENNNPSSVEPGASAAAVSQNQVHPDEENRQNTVSNLPGQNQPASTKPKENVGVTWTLHRAPHNNQRGENSSTQLPRPPRPVLRPVQNLYSRMNDGFLENCETSRGTRARALTPENVAARKALDTRLPKFSGNPEDWPLFICKYENTTTACGYSDLENLSRLQDALTGEALEAVRSRLSLPKQVPHIIETLRTFFGRADIVVNQLIEKLRLEKDPSIYEFNTFTNYALKIENLVAQMQMNSLSEYLWDMRLLSELVERLPPQWQLEWARYYSNAPVANLEVFGHWINNEAVNISRISSKPFISSSIESTKETKPNNKKAKGYIHLHSTSNKTAECIVSDCSSSCENVEECKTFLGLPTNEKWNIVKENNICRKCLRKCRNRCGSRKVCGVDGCKYLHNNVLHNHKSQPARGTVSTSNDITPEIKPIIANCQTHHQTNSTTTFRVVPVRLFNGIHEVDTFAMLDAGSSLTLLENDLADTLKIEGVKQPLCL